MEVKHRPIEVGHRPIVVVLFQLEVGPALQQGILKGPEAFLIDNEMDAYRLVTSSAFIFFFFFLFCFTIPLPILFSHLRWCLPLIKIH